MSNEFKLVTHKRKGKAVISEKPQKSLNSPQTPNKESQIKRIIEAKLEILESDLYSSVLASLREGLTILEKPLVKEIVCFGLGRIGECTISRYQFAFLLCLKDLYNVTLKIYDPIFTDNDLWILQSFDCCILKENLEGKYKIQDKSTTLFYLPHCPKQLSNNLLWANWGLDLNYCIIISNSFNTIVENFPTRILQNTGEFIKKIYPYTLELAVINSFKFYEIFNDTAIHVFPWTNISLITDDFWNYCSEPKYKVDDIEFITSKITNDLLIT